MNRRRISQCMNELDIIIDKIHKECKHDKRARNDLKDLTREYLHLTSSFIYSSMKLINEYRFYTNKGEYPYESNHS